MSFGKCLFNLNKKKCSSDKLEFIQNELNKKNKSIEKIEKLIGDIKKLKKLDKGLFDLKESIDVEPFNDPFIFCNEKVFSRCEGENGYEISKKRAEFLEITKREKKIFSEYNKILEVIGGIYDYFKEYTDESDDKFQNIFFKLTKDRYDKYFVLVLDLNKFSKTTNNFFELLGFSGNYRTSKKVLKVELEYKFIQNKLKINSFVTDEEKRGHGSIALYTLEEVVIELNKIIEGLNESQNFKYCIVEEVIGNIKVEDRDKEKDFKSFFAKRDYFKNNEIYKSFRINET